MSIVAVRIVLAILSALLFGGFIAVDLWGLVPRMPWQGPFIAAFVAFGLTMAWGWGATEIQLHRRPRIRVTPTVVNQKAVLEVRNRGGEAMFTAKCRVISGIPGPEWFTMYWESNSHSSEMRIDHDGLQTVFAGRVAVHTVESMDIYQGGLVLYKLGGEGEQLFPAQTLETTKVDETWASPELEERCVLEVLITASPAMKEPYMKMYLRWR